MGVPPNMTILISGYSSSFQGKYTECLINYDNLNFRIFRLIGRETLDVPINKVHFKLVTGCPLNVQKV